MAITTFNRTGSSATTAGNSIVAAGDVGAATVTATASLTTVIAHRTIRFESRDAGRTLEALAPLLSVAHPPDQQLIVGWHVVIGDERHILCLS